MGVWVQAEPFPCDGLSVALGVISHIADRRDNQDWCPEDLHTRLASHRMHRTEGKLYTAQLVRVLLVQCSAML